MTIRPAFLIALLALAAVAQEKRPPLAVDAVLVKPEELPKNVKVVEGIHSVSPQAKTYFETPAIKDIMKTLAPEVVERVREELLDRFPVPKRKECQSLRAEGRAAGSIFVYEYEEEAAARDVLPFLESYLWGGRRSEQHPEEIVVEGRFLWVLSFPYPPGDPAAEWYKDRLRRKFRVPAFRERPELASLRQQIVKAFDAKDADAGIRLLQQNAKAAADWSFAQCMLGQFAEMKKDNALAEKGFRKALQLHDAITDPLDPRLVWVTVDGLALALHAQGKRPEAVKLFDRAIVAADASGEGAKKAEAQSRYNLACAYSMMKKYPEALDSLQDAIGLDSSYRGMARTDADFAEARKLKEFQDLLAEPKTVALTLDAVLVKPEELPKNVHAIEGIHTNEPHPRAFFETPNVEGIAKILPPQLRAMIPKEYMETFPVPKRKECQSFLAEGGEKGTVFVFEYETDDLRIVTSFLEPILWGEGGPSEDHPEEIIVHGRILWVLSFPRGDPAAEWYKERLRKNFRVPAPRVRPDLDPLGASLSEIFAKQDADAGLKFLNENAKAVEEWAFGQCMLGQFAAMKKDYVLAEKAFRKALALHEGLEDPLDRNFVWATLDGLGSALAGQGKSEEAARMFERAIAAGNQLDDPWAATRSCYNIACVLAKMEQWGEARRALAQAISVDGKYKKIARADPDLAEARKRPEFQELLK